MTPEEIECTKEPIYDRVAYWLPMFQPQRSQGMTPLLESPETSDANSDQEGSNTPNLLSSRDTTPPVEGEITLQHSTAKNIIDNTRVETTLEEIRSDGTRTPPADMSPLVDFRPSTPLMAPVDRFFSGNILAENARCISEDEYPSLGVMLHDGKVVSVDAMEADKPNDTTQELNDSDAVTISQNNDNEAGEKLSTQPELELQPASLLNHTAPGRAIDAKEEQDSIIRPPSVAIAFPPTYSATDPPSTRLRHTIANSPSIILCPGVYDGLSARIALHVGFKGMYMTGAGTTASCLGASDLGIAQLHEMRTNAEMIANLNPDGPPLIADMDTGYGGPLIIRRAVQQYARAGVAAFHIEDQVPEKRCGHLAGKEVVDTESYLGRIKACIYARAQIRSDIIIIARTDALQSRGYDECVERLRRARDLGADMGILEGVSSKEMAARAVQDLAPWPLCYNSVENGYSPLITAAEAQDMGYRVMIFSFAGIAPAYAAILETFTRLKEHGVTGSVVGPKKIFELCGLEEEMRIDEAAGGMAFAKGV